MTEQYLRKYKKLFKRFALLGFLGFEATAIGGLELVKKILMPFFHITILQPRFCYANPDPIDYDDDTGIYEWVYKRQKKVTLIYFRYVDFVDILVTSLKSMAVFLI